MSAEPEANARPPHEKIEKTLSMAAANLWGTLLAMPVFALFLIPYHLLWQPVGEQLAYLVEGNTWLAVVLLGVSFLMSIAIHEFLHVVGFVMGGAQWSHIKVGVQSATPFVHCKVLLRLKAYRLAVVLPGLLLGILPGIGGLLSGSFAITLYGAIMTAAAVGDGMILWLLRDAPSHARVLDHPHKVGCVLYV